MRKTVTTTADKTLRELAREEGVTLKDALDYGLRELVKSKGKRKYLELKREELIEEVHRIDTELEALQGAG